MKQKRFLASLSFVLIAVLLAGLFTPAGRTFGQGGCGTAPPARLIVGGQARVTFTDGTPLRVRDAAGLAGNQVSQLPEGTSFQVIGGPVCADNYNWWQIQAGEVYGWVAEGGDGVYFAEPVGTAAAPTVPTTTSLSSGTGPFATWNWAALTTNDWEKSVPDPMLLQLPAAYAGNMPALPVDLSSVRFIDDARLNDTQKALLAQNGFVVVPAGFDQFTEAYREDEVWQTVPPNFTYDIDSSQQDIGHGFFVTTDATLHTLHYIFDNLLTDLEKSAFQPIMVTEVLLPTLQAAHAQTQEAQGTALADSAVKAETFLVVALELFAPGSAAHYTSPEVLAAAQPVIAMAQAGEGQLQVPFLDSYLEDFSQYRPRGHYTDDPILSQYFQGMMWVSRITFLANDDSATQIALLLLRALQNGSGALAGWQKIHDLLTFLIGPVDDLGPQDYLPLAGNFFRPDLPLETLADPAQREGFRAELAKLPAPRVNGMVLSADTEASEMADKTRGFRFLGQRFTLDAYVMQQLMYPYVGTRENPRPLPLGLDVPSAVSGSQVAYNLALEAGAGNFANYDTQVLSLASQIGVLTQDEWLENLYGSWLWALQPLWNRATSPYPPLMNTEAWWRKDLQTGLGSWTELKHDTVLYAKQPTGFGGGGPPMTSFGYVEPNPEVFARIAIVAGLTYEGLTGRGIGQRPIQAGYDVRVSGYLMPFLRQDPGLLASVGELKTLAVESARFAEMARKELNGETLTDDEYYTILDFSDYLYVVLHTLYQGEGQPKPVALVTDVASNTTMKTVLQEAVGGVDYIYVVTPNPRGGYQVVRGGVFSYYEWVGNIDQRMTDEEWRAQVTAGTVPLRPAWTSTFFSP